MPTYTYRCPACGRQWDEQRKIDDPSVGVSRVEECDGVPGARVFNPGDMRPVYKGKDWPRRDHKDASRP